MHTRFRKPVAYVLGLALLWAVLALGRPETTFHLAPALIAVTGVLAAAGQLPTRPKDAVVIVTVSAFTAVTATALLAAAGALRGPSLLPAGGAVTESLLAALAGTAVATTVAWWSLRRRA